MVVKGRGVGEDEDIDALLTKKSFKELQQSKTGEELLELLHRPTAKETANAAKVTS
jgi:mRNA (2'-O-methyladenosine-N6-)-methyltransferase